MANPIDDQPIAATFFGEGKWLTAFVTPDALEVQELHKNLTSGISNLEDRLVACWSWVAREVKYVKFVRGKLWVMGHASVQDDLWNTPAITRRVKVGNCANKSFLLGSLLRNELSADAVHCVLGNLHNGKAGGHVWIQLSLGGQEYIMESTRSDVHPLVPVANTERYEGVHLFNDKGVFSIEGRTVLTPYTACYSEWLSDYLDYAYIEGRK
ncbi:hypothetical protein LCGC14_0655030 [marine sediment metagenome]|uniref:Transglutaminase-like domain-containing protein n=1 Tax=marine sediment metagenome TaxID=412755 RepID=A0A0F9TH03_9ZZZZ